MTKLTKELAQTGVQAEEGMSTLPCPGGGRNPIKLRSLKFRLGFLPSIGKDGSTFVSFPPQRKVDETIGYIKVHLSTLTNLFEDRVNLLMQRHDDEVRNNVIHPSVICPCPSRPLATQSDGSGDYQTRQKRKERKNQKKGEGSKKTEDYKRIRAAIMPPSRETQDTTANAQAKTHFPPSPTLCPVLSMPGRTMYVVAMYRELSHFPKAISCSSLKATTNLASRYSVEPIKRHPALRPLPPVCLIH